MDNTAFGQFVAEIRKGRSLTQSDLASALHVNDKAVSRWECGQNFPDLQLL